MAIDDYSTFEVFVLRSLIFLLSYAVGVKQGHNAVDLIEEIRKELR